MSHTPESRLESFIALLREHLAAVRDARGEADFAVEALYDRLAEAYDDYAEVLDDEFGESLPFEVVEDD